MPTYEEGEAVGISNLPCLDMILTASVLCNSAELGEGGAPDTGDPLEQALLVAGLTAEKTRSDYVHQFPKLREIAFDSTSKLMATIHRADDHNVMWVKGAPEAVLDASSRIIRKDGSATDLSRDLADIWRRRTDEMAARGMRVLALPHGRSAMWRPRITSALLSWA